MTQLRHVFSGGFFLLLCVTVSASIVLTPTVGSAEDAKQSTQTTYTKKTITHALAARMVEAATARAKELGVKQNVAVVDDGGNLKAFARMDGAPLLGIEGSQRKAYTALFGFGTADFYNAIKDNPALLVGLSHFEGATVVGGGLPITIDGEVVGGIGVGGGTVEQDISCAEAGVQVLGE